MASRRLADPLPGSTIAPLLGRAPEVARLTAWQAALAAGQGRVALIEGEPGIGKSALLRDAFDRASRAGVAAFWGAGEELGAAFPLLPLLTAFAIRESSADPRRAEILRVLRGKDLTVAAGSGPEAVAAAAERLITLIDDVCAADPAVLVLDDLHWADSATVAVCRRLADSTAQRSLLLVASMRPVPRRDDLRALHDDIDPDGVLPLGPLPDAAVTDLVTDRAGGVPGPGLARLAAGARGNPLYLTELVDALDRSDSLVVRGGVAEVTGESTARTLIEAISDRLDFLSVSVRQMLEAAALLGNEFAVADLALVLRRPPADLAESLQEARAAGVLTDTGDLLAFRHPLIRTALYDDLPSSAKVAWHRQTARDLYAAGAPDQQIARQLLAAAIPAAPAGGGHYADWVADWLLGAAPGLVAEAPQVAVQLLEPVVGRLPASDRRRHMLAGGLARALTYQARYDEVEVVIGRTLPHVTDPDLLVELYDTLVGTREATASGFEQTLAELDHVAANPTLDAGHQLRLRVLAARAEVECVDPRPLEPVMRQILADAVAAGDRWAIAWMCNNLGKLLWAEGNVQAAPRLIDQALAAVEGESALLDLKLMLLRNRGISQTEVNRFDEARATLTEGLRLAERSGKLRRAAQLQQSLCQLLFEAGEWDDALAAATLPEDVDEPVIHFRINHMAATILFHRGQPSARERLAAANRYADRVIEVGNWRLTDALAHEVDGDPEGALRVLVAALAEHTGLIDSVRWLTDAVRLATAFGDVATASAATAEAARLARQGRQAPQRAAIHLHCRGLREAEPQLLLDAAESYGGLLRPLPTAQALEAAAALLAERGDAAGARPHFAAALDLYARLGADWDVARMRTRFRPYGLQGARSRRRAETGWDALTATELTVTELLCEGLTNREIADRLAISRRTVDTHVAKILAKLQVRSRAEAVRIATGRDR